MIIFVYRDTSDTSISGRVFVNKCKNEEFIPVLNSILKYSKGYCEFIDILTGDSLVV